MLMEELEQKQDSDPVSQNQPNHTWKKWESSLALRLGHSVHQVTF